ncbi:MAG: 50S ribosomal protein L30 [Deltaproteobacteria bacterium]|nr:MAG: 50S ribosomal protein L30 [Deltaproteobacteria bacterium]
MIKVRLVKSVIGSKPRQRKTVRALGLGKIDSVNELPDNPCTRGMIQRVRHLVEVDK